jgi:hypothetical protein
MTGRERKPTARGGWSLDEGENGENETLRFAKRNEAFRSAGLKSLKSSWPLNHAFRGIVCFQWVDPHFVSHRFALRLSVQEICLHCGRSGPSDLIILA